MSALVEDQVLDLFRRLDKSAQHRLLHKLQEVVGDTAPQSAMNPSDIPVEPVPPSEFDAPKLPLDEWLKQSEALVEAIRIELGENTIDAQALIDEVREEE